MKDRQQATIARDEAIERGWKNAAVNFRGHALEAIVALAESRDEFTTDDVWEYFDENEITTTHDGRALGGAMRYAAKLHLITPTDRFVSLDRVECHRRPVRVWRSFGGK